MALHFDRAEYDARIARVRAALERASLDGLLLFQQESMYYLTGYDTFGFCFFQCLYLGVDGRLALLTRSADLRQAQRTSIIEDIRVWTDAQAATPAGQLRAMLADLRARNIEPLVTLHHFTHPIWFEDRGGFLAADAPERFARYAAFAAQELGDLCDVWCTINEPNVFAVYGYQIGDFPPGRRGDIRATARVLGNLARAHAAAYYAIHAAQPAARVAWAQHYNIFDPARPRNPLDRFVAGLQDRAFNDFFPQAVLEGKASFPFGLLAGDLSAARGTCDYIGLNAYGRDLVAFDPRVPLELFGRRFAAPGAPHGDTGHGHLYGEIYPQGIVRLIQRVGIFGKPIYITENGVADAADRLRP